MIAAIAMILEKSTDYMEKKKENSSMFTAMAETIVTMIRQTSV